MDGLLILAWGWWGVAQVMQLITLINPEEPGRKRVINETIAYVPPPTCHHPSILAS